MTGAPDAAGLPHVVIVGGGFAGLYAAKALSDAPVRVTLVDRRNHHLFQPMLYQVATAGLNPSDIASPIRSILRRSRNTEVLLAEVDAIDPEARRVHLTDGDALTYDYLLVATGAQHSYFGHDEWEEFAPGLKTLEQATEIRRRVLIAFEEAERIRDPSHVRNYSEDEWRALVTGAGLDLAELRILPHRFDLDAWLMRTGCEGDEADRVTALLGDRARDGRLTLDKIAVLARRRA